MPKKNGSTGLGVSLSNSNTTSPHAGTHTCTHKVIREYTHAHTLNSLPSPPILKKKKKNLKSLSCDSQVSSSSGKPFCLSGPQGHGTSRAVTGDQASPDTEFEALTSMNLKRANQRAAAQGGPGVGSGAWVAFGCTFPGRPASPVDSRDLGQRIS